MGICRKRPPEFQALKRNIFIRSTIHSVQELRYVRVSTLSAEKVLLLQHPNALTRSCHCFIPQSAGLPARAN